MYLHTYKNPISHLLLMSTQKIFTMVVGVIAGVLLIMGIVMPIITETAYDEETRVIPSTLNENPVGDLRLTYVSGVFLDKYVSFTVGENISLSKGDIAYGEIQPADYQYSPTADMILFASDGVSVIVEDMALYLSVDGSSHIVSSALTIRMEDKLYITEGDTVSEHAYSYAYYPDANGTYANYLSYTHDNGEMYATGSFAGISLSVKNGEMIGDYPYGFSATVDDDGDKVSGVHYEVI